MKTIIHYQNGKSYTYSGYTIDGWVDWEANELRLISETDKLFTKPKTVRLTEDTLWIETSDSECSYYSCWTNPNYDFSVKMDVMTAKSRAKANNLLLNMCSRTMKALKVLKENV